MTGKRQHAIDGWDDATSRLADFVLNPPLLSTEILGRVTAPILDSLAVMLAGARSEAGAAALRYARHQMPGRPAWVVGSTSSAPAEVAALVNATAGHALDYDDALPGSGHLAVPTLAAILASASTTASPLKGRQLQRAFTIGFEVAAKLGKAYGVEHYRRGWHTTATGGVFGAAAAAATILHLTPVQVRTSIGIAASLAGGLQRHFGTTAKPLHSGLAARNGVMAVQLAAAGFSADEHILDGTGGLLDLFGGDYARPEVMTELGDPWSLVDPGTALKRYPCCYAAARPVDALLKLQTDHPTPPKKIERIRCIVPKSGLHPMIHHAPTTGLAAKFSMEYILAAAAYDGRVDLETFTDAAVSRSEVRRLMTRVETAEDRTLRPEDPDAERSSPATGGSVIVEIHRTDGSEVSMQLTHPAGSPGNPFTAEMFEAKIRSCATMGGFDTERVIAVFDHLAPLGEVEDVIALIEQIGSPDG